MISVCEPKCQEGPRTEARATAMARNRDERESRDTEMFLTAKMYVVGEVLQEVIGHR